MLKFLKYLACLAVFSSLSGRGEANEVDAANNSARPIVPMMTGAGHWDHHWIFWLPHHSEFELVEVAINDPAKNKEPQVWAWFTERKGNKRQHHYRTAALPRHSDAHIASFDYQITGEVGGPRGLALRFSDTAGRDVRINAQMAPDAKLSTSRAGLTSQMGHNIDRIFLLFYRTASVFPAQASVVIDGQNVTFAPDEALGNLPFRWSYSSDVHTGVIVYGKYPISFGSDGFAPDAEKKGSFSLTDKDGGIVAITSDTGGRLLTYRHTTPDGGLLHFQFDQGLPNCRDKNPIKQVRFGIYLKGAGEVINGLIDTACSAEGATYVWRPITPRYVWGRTFSTQVRVLDANRDEVSVGPQSATIAPH